MTDFADEFDDNESEAEAETETTAGAASMRATAMGLFDIRHLTVAQLAALGVSHLAYVKPVLVNGTRAFAIHGADGTPMAVAGAEDLAFAAIRQHEMVPAHVH